MAYERKIKKILKLNNGCITTKQIENLGIPRVHIPKYIEQGILRRVERGIYVATDYVEDEYYIYQIKYSNTVFSHNTAFHLLGMSERTPYGNNVNVYNHERSLCDMFRNRDEFDLETYNKIIEAYFSSKEKDLKRLLEYSKIFNIYEKVNTILEVMSK